MSACRMVACTLFGAVALTIVLMPPSPWWALQFVWGSRSVTVEELGP